MKVKLIGTGLLRLAAVGAALAVVAGCRTTEYRHHDQGYYGDGHHAPAHYYEHGRHVSSRCEACRHKDGRHEDYHHDQDVRVR